MEVALYGDRHSSEVCAEEIQEKINSQSPEAIMKEAPQIRGKRSSYIMSSLVRFASIGEVYEAFNLDVRKIEKLNTEICTEAMYNVEADQLMRYTKFLCNKFNIDTEPKNFDDPDNVILTREKDKAIYSIYKNIDFKKDPEKSTLTPRLCLLIKWGDIEFYNIDVPEEKWAKWAAKNIEKAPSSIRGVLKLIEQYRRGNVSSDKEQLAKEVLAETKNYRDKTMASQIYKNLEEDGYSNVAAIMGSDHVENVQKYLQRQGISAEIMHKAS